MTAIHLNLDNAWPAGALPLETLDATAWGPHLRFSAPARLMEKFYGEIAPDLPPFVAYGSGDFHHLTALLVRRVEGPLVILSFDNHPDWDIRPPRWCCGGWVNRALELWHVRKVSVWGCGNFECWWPGQIFGNRRAEREGRLDVHAWADDCSQAKQLRRGAILRGSWRDQFLKFIRALYGLNIYVTIDLDCLRPDEAITNWESGRFTLEDLSWALTAVRASKSHIVAGDLCGAFSPPTYARRGQRFIAEIDHPKLAAPDAGAAIQTNLRAFKALWPLLAD